MKAWESHGAEKIVNGVLVGYYPYDIGDGGMTYGYGYWVKHGSDLSPWLDANMQKGYLTLSEADELYRGDMVSRISHITDKMKSDKVVLYEYEIEALVSIYYNSPRFFTNELWPRVKQNIKNETTYRSVCYDYIDKNTAAKFRKGVKHRRDGELKIFFHDDYSLRP